jgi:dephospho-CoA kinase
MASSGRSPSRTVVIGVTGLPAAGKSTVTGILASLGGVVVDADALAHEALGRPSMARAVERALGPGLRLPGGAVDRAAVARRVFGARAGASLRRLTALLHPPVLRAMRRAVRAARRARAETAILDVPLLFEAGADRECDYTVFVEAPRAVRLYRARARGWSAAELRRRESRQAPAAVRRRRADATVDNGGSLAATRRRVREIRAAALARAS